MRVALGEQGKFADDIRRGDLTVPLFLFITRPKTGQEGPDSFLLRFSFNSRTGGSVTAVMCLPGN